MNTEFEELVRDSMQRSTAGLQAPADLAGRARRAHRRRRQLAASAVALGTAAVTAAAVIAVTGPGTRTGTGATNAQTTAYVITRIENAVGRINMVVRTETVFNPAFPPIVQWTYHGNLNSAQSGLMPPAQVRGLPWAQGQESWGAGTAKINGKRTYVQVDYRRREWYPAGGFLTVPNGCSGSLYLAEFNTVNWASYVRHTLACGQFKIVRHGQVDGREIIMITGSQTVRNWWHGRSFRADATLYVDPSTYIPVRLIWSNSTHAADGKPLHGIVSQDIRLLPPTSRNMARASITIPAGFREVRSSLFGGPIFPLW